jgi:hypothetical protein
MKYNKNLKKVKKSLEPTVRRVQYSTVKKLGPPSVQEL